MSFLNNKFYKKKNSLHNKICIADVSTIYIYVRSGLVTVLLVYVPQHMNFTINGKRKMTSITYVFIIHIFLSKVIKISKCIFKYGFFFAVNTQLKLMLLTLTVN